MRKNVMKLTAGVLSTAVLTGMFAIRRVITSRRRMATGKRTGLLTAASMNMYH